MVQSQGDNAATKMTIRELADRTGVSIDTIRFYEKRGWLNAVHVQRQANNQPQPTSVP
ncbi:hypothetical protein XM38_014990 [Halomicronema hongdechloris C2206]|uniref:HTH merR-type domain-containing protein n=1 Tax=Halomicronema hongdechloris C2206 TaxID=1641165 RepID=A0A1Z3HJS1_9CYAN|nr:hypothetical protein XM38_014990 [Halomicronema hongdechloris C2206]